MTERVEWHASAESTNTLALACREDGKVFVADVQTAGRGRHGRAWESRPGLGLWFSMAVDGPALGLPFAAVLAVRAALADHVVLNLKWPNDLVCARRKVCGVLAESRAGWSAIGVGLNVLHGQGDFSEALRGTATSLAQIAPGPWDRAALLAAIVDALDARIARLRAGGLDSVMAEWSAATDLIGRRARYGGEEGVVIAVERDGALRVETAQGARTWRDAGADMGSLQVFERM